MSLATTLAGSTQLQQHPSRPSQMSRQLSLCEVDQLPLSVPTPSAWLGTSRRARLDVTALPYMSSFYEDLTKCGQICVAKSRRRSTCIGSNGMILGAGLILSCSHSISSRSNYLVFSPQFLASPTSDFPFDCKNYWHLLCEVDPLYKLSVTKSAHPKHDSWCCSLPRL
jgi:hypothetical protein